MPIIKIKDFSMYYVIHGEGEPLVLIAGLGNDVTDLQTIFPHFSKTYQVITFDNRGAGRTDKPNIPYTTEMMAADTWHLLQALHIGQACVIGVSMGGRIAAELTLQHPEQVKRLVLVSTSLNYHHRSLSGRLLFFIMSLPILRILDKYPQPRYAFLRQRETAKTYDCTARLQEIQVPTLIVHGKKDRLVPYTSAIEIHNGIPGSTLKLLNGGHLMFFWSAKCLDVIQTFLETS